MPRLSRTPSPPVTPTSGTAPTADNNVTMKRPSLMTYTPPLRDGACGTTPRAQQPLWTLVRRELAQMLRLMPGLCWAMVTQSGAVAWVDRAAMGLHAALACLEMGMLLAAVPRLVLPGGVFAVWVCVCAGMVAAMCWMLNGRAQMHLCNAGAGSEGWMMGQEAEDEKWLFVSGMGMRCV